MLTQVLLRRPISEADHIEGSLDSSIKLVKYGDYQCHHCRQAHFAVKEYIDDFDHDLAFVFRHFPLPKHPLAYTAAIAAEAAGRQGWFWEMHDGLFENQDFLSTELIFSLARDLDLDMYKFASDMESHDVDQTVTESILGGAQSGVAGTPTFFVNGLCYEGDWSSSEFFRTLEIMRKGAPRLKPESSRHDTTRFI